MLYIWKKGDSMIKVDVIELQKYVIELQNLIEELELIQLNLFNQVKEGTMNWQDGHSIRFNDGIYNEKKEANMFLSSLKNKVDIYNYICDKYSEIGKKIFCSLNNKDQLLNVIDSCYNETIKILNEYEEIDISFFYNEKKLIFLQKNKLLQVKNDLTDIKTHIINIFKQIENIEKEIKIKIELLDKIKLNSFEYYEE